MKALCFCVMVAFAASLSGLPPANAGTQEGAVFALHAKAHTTKPTTLCTTWKPAISCNDYNTEWPVGTNTDVYLVIVAPDSVAGVAGATCGIYYTAAEHVGVDMFGWMLCADMEYTNAGPHGEWPAAGGGNRIVWFADTNCQRTVIGEHGVHAVAGAFYLYAYREDVFRVTPDWNQAPAEVTIVDCNGSTTYLWRWIALGAVGFYNTNWCRPRGCNPCAHSVGMEGCDCIWGTPVERTTWGAIKQAY